MRNVHCWAALAQVWVVLGGVAVAAPPALAHHAEPLTLRVVAAPQPLQGPQLVEVSLFEWGISADARQVPAGPVTFRVSNDGQFGHALAVTGPGGEDQTEVFPGGQSRTLQVDLPPGEIVLWCPVPGHRDLCMETALSARGPGGGGPTVLAALDANANGFIDDPEVLVAVGLWAAAAPGPALGRALSDAEVLAAVRLWATGQALG